MRIMINSTDSEGAFPLDTFKKFKIHFPEAVGWDEMALNLQSGEYLKVMGMKDKVSFPVIRDIKVKFHAVPHPDEQNPPGSEIAYANTVMSAFFTEEDELIHQVDNMDGPGLIEIDQNYNTSLALINNAMYSNMVSIQNRTNEAIGPELELKLIPKEGYRLMKPYLNMYTRKVSRTLPETLATIEDYEITIDYEVMEITIEQLWIRQYKDGINKYKPEVVKWRSAKWNNDMTCLVNCGFVEKPQTVKPVTIE